MADTSDRSGSAMSIPLSITLRYDHGLGALSPYFEGLLAGRLMATTCQSCQSTWAPPRLVCTCGNTTLSWLELSGQGSCTQMTSTLSLLPAAPATQLMTFGLVAFDGATNRALVRLCLDLPTALPARVTLRRRSARPPPGHPVEALEVVVTT